MTSRRRERRRRRIHGKSLISEVSLYIVCILPDTQELSASSDCCTAPALHASVPTDVDQQTSSLLRPSCFTSIIYSVITTRIVFDPEDGLECGVVRHTHETRRSTASVTSHPMPKRRHQFSALHLFSPGSNTRYLLGTCASDGPSRNLKTSSVPLGWNSNNR